jgi:5-methylcytosine-specific restriction endonuclease McrA
MTITERGTKVCRTCGIEKALSEFNKDSCKSDGYYTMCKQCKRNYRTSEKYHTRERALEKTPRYRHRASLTAHKERSSKPHTLTYEEWDFIQKKQNNKCAICGSEETLVRDCMIPLSLGGTLSYWNTQALCAACNNHKGAKAYGGILGNRWRRDWVIEPTPA